MTLTASTSGRARPAPSRRHDAWPRAHRAAASADRLARASHRPANRRQELIAEVVELNMGVADAIASRYRGRGVDDEDLRQAAYLAVTKAAQKFDPNAGHDFLSYAVPTIRGELRRYFRDLGWMVRPPRRIQELQRAIFAAQSELALRLGRSPSTQEVADDLGEPREDVEEALAADGCFTAASLDGPIASDAEWTLGDLLGEPDPQADAAEARVMLAPVVRGLGERDKLVLRRRFFDGYSQEEIAREIGVTQTHVSRLLSRILLELRKRLEAAGASDRPV